MLRLSDTDSTPAKTAEITLAEAGLDASVTVGSANSVAAHKGLIAVAVEAQDPQSSGFIALFRADTRALINTYPAGAMPDMVTFSPDGRYIVSANEGEPSGDYSNDPAGTVTIVDISAGFSDEQALVAQVGFGALDLAAFKRYQTAKWFLGSAQFFAQQTDQFTTTRTGNLTPFAKCLFGVADDAGHLCRIGLDNRCEFRTINRGLDFQRAFGDFCFGQTKFGQDGCVAHNKTPFVLNVPARITGKFDLCSIPKARRV